MVKINQTFVRVISFNLNEVRNETDMTTFSPRSYVRSRATRKTAELFGILSL